MIDFTGDGLLNVADIDAVCHAIGANDTKFDVDRDGTVTTEDVYSLVENLLHSSVGDANLDGVFTV